MYCLVPEKLLRLVYETFYLAISDTFYETVNFNEFVKSRFYLALESSFSGFEELPSTLSFCLKRSAPQAKRSFSELLGMLFADDY